MLMVEDTEDKRQKPLIGGEVQRRPNSQLAAPRGQDADGMEELAHGAVGQMHARGKSVGFGRHEVMERRRPDAVIVAVVAVGADVGAEQHGEGVLDAVEPPRSLFGILAVVPKEDGFGKIMGDHEAVVLVRPRAVDTGRCCGQVGPKGDRFVSRDRRAKCERGARYQVWPPIPVSG
jgi:hypothetical protein